LDQQREIALTLDIAACLDVDAMHRSAGRTGLLGHQCVADYRIGRCTYLLDRPRESHAALAIRIVGEAAGAAATGMDLRLHDVNWPWELARRGHCLVRGPGDMTVRHRHTVPLQQFLGLVLVDVHGCTLSRPLARRGWGKGAFAVNISCSAKELLSRLDQLSDRRARRVESGLLRGIQFDL